MKNIVLIGMPGAGKTTLAKQYAQVYTEYTAIDTDEYIAGMYGKTVSEIIASEGIEIFRKYETEALKEILQGEGQIISAGGGIVTCAESRNILETQYCIFLYVSVAFLYNNLYKDIVHGNKRFLFSTTKGLYASIANLWQERREAYYCMASKTIAVNGIFPREICDIL